MIQKSYEKENGNLYIVPTPIGNLKDITYRAVDVLSMVDAIFAEDTRVTIQLLNNLNIKTRVYPCHKFNENKVSGSVINLLSQDKNVAIVTDRGTPLISDPGSVVVDKVILAGYNVIALPGASALLPALNMSNISSEKFLFYGFLSSKEGESKNELSMLKSINFTIVLYEAPHRLCKTLQNIFDILGDRRISISREISKIHEEVFRGSVKEALDFYKEIKGEIVIVIERGNEEINYEELLNKVDELIGIGVSSKDAIKKISKEYDVSKNILYNMFEERKNEISSGSWKSR